MYILFLALLFPRCRNIDVTEQVDSLPGHLWYKTHKVVIELQVKDSAMHNLYFILRHTQKFPYTNLLANLTIEDSAKHILENMKLNLPLIKKDGNWSGKNMDDLYDHRIKIDKPVFLQKGIYRFILQHEMKENSLPYVLDAGIEIRKTTGSQ